MRIKHAKDQPKPGYTELRPGIHPTDHPLEAAFIQGRLAYSRGAEKPPEPGDEWDCTPTQAFWLGYMFQRALGIMEEQRQQNRSVAIKNYIEDGLDLPDDL